MTARRDRHSPPRRPTVAGLRTSGGKRIGRFGLHTSGGRTWHHWEWLEDPWPDESFAMAPDDLEPAPSQVLSEIYPMPPAIESLVAGARDISPDRRDRVYDVLRTDCSPRLLAVLIVAGPALHWLEIDAGGALEIAPGWLRFEPRSGVGAHQGLTRRLIQRRVDPLRVIETDPIVPQTSRAGPEYDLRRSCLYR